jgi:hypothetical protein
MHSSASRGERKYAWPSGRHGIGAYEGPIIERLGIMNGDDHDVEDNMHTKVVQTFQPRVAMPYTVHVMVK